MKTRPNLKEFVVLKKFEDANSDISQDSASTHISPDFCVSESSLSKKRNRKNDEQINLLISEFYNNPFWSRDGIKRLSSITGLSEAQIYKWNWDFKKKNKNLVKANYESRLLCKESLPPTQYDSDLVFLQRLYKLGFTNISVSSPTKFLYN